MTARSDLVAAVRDGLLAAADASRAPAMQAYMKSAQPYLGVPVPEVRSIVRRAARTHRTESAEQVRDTATVLWREATHREHRYAATELTGLPPAATSLALVPLWTELVVTGAWWDHVDAVAPRVGRLLLVHRDEVRPLLLAWSRDADRWLRRASVIAQLGARQRTDVDLLTAVIDANAADRDRFVAKAVGWALRDYARTDPDWVRGFVAARTGELSPLSVREATKHLGGPGSPG